jgi:hypothetical protein
MANSKETKKKLLAQIEAVKKINDDPKGSLGSIADSYQKNIPDPNELFSKKSSDLKNKLKSKVENNKDIFKELLEITEQFITSNKKTKTDTTPTKSDSVPVNVDKNLVKGKIKRYAVSSAKTTLKSAKQIAIKHFSEALFMGDGICGSQSVFNIDSIVLKPDEFDFLDIFTIDPDSDCGQLIYEKKSPDKNKQKANRNFYDLMSSGGLYTYSSNNGKNLFTSQWSASTQQFLITGLTQGSTGTTKVQNFIQDYYESLEFPDIEEIMKTAMMLTIQGGSSCSESSKFTTSLNKSLRLIDKLFKVCGSNTQKDELKNQTPVDMFSENDQDIEFYFDFDDVEGIDLDDEQNRFRRVLKFKDCYNFEIPVDDMHVEDFIYLTNNQNIEKAVDNTLANVAKDALSKSDSSFDLTAFLNNLLNNFIISLPKALVMSILSAKIFLPIIILYKIFKTGLTNVYLNSKELAKKFYKAIGAIIKDLFWLFIKEFWRLIKVDLLAFIQSIVQRIIKNKYKRYLLIITSLIALLKKALESEINNCYDLFQTILSTIEAALSQKAPISIPSILLLFSDSLPGFSQDRAFMNIMNKLESAGVPTGPLYGDSNDIGNVVKSVVDGYTEEEDANSFIKIVLKGGTLPGPPLAGGAVIPPGLITGVGKKQ